MIDKRLIGLVPESKKHIFLSVALSLAALVCNVGLIALLTALLQGAVGGGFTALHAYYAGGAALLILVRFVLVLTAERAAARAATTVKKKLRLMLFDKLDALGVRAKDSVSGAELTQVALEGVEQLDVYFSLFLPKFFYAIAAPVALFAMLSGVSILTAGIMLALVPMIPLSIMMIMRFAKRLFSKYWGRYNSLGDRFLDNVRGLTALKIYRADAERQIRMGEEAEDFRIATMKVLTMQLGSVTVMDLVAFGGAAAGIITALLQLLAGALPTAYHAIFLAMVSAEFFIPMRLLGSAFHIAMNGMTAAKKMYALLDMPEERGGSLTPESGEFEVQMHGVSFGYNKDTEVLHNVGLKLSPGRMVAAVGKSGCGKSTIVSLIMGQRPHYGGSITADGHEVRSLSRDYIMQNIAAVSFDSYIFKGTVRENLLMARQDAGDDALWQVLERVDLAETVRQMDGGLSAKLSEGASNLSGGQRQRLALARSLLKDGKLYIFDEATSNIDMQSEAVIMDVIRSIAREKAVLLISHRLRNVTAAQEILFMEKGVIAERGTHEQLMQAGGGYSKLFGSQQKLEDQYKEELSYAAQRV